MSCLISFFYVLIASLHTDLETGIVCINVFGDLQTRIDLYVVVFSELTKCAIWQNVCGKHSCKEKWVVYFINSADIDPVFDQ